MQRGFTRAVTKAGFTKESFDKAKQLALAVWGHEKLLNKLLKCCEDQDEPRNRGRDSAAVAMEKIKFVNEIHKLLPTTNVPRPTVAAPAAPAATPPPPPPPPPSATSESSAREEALVQAQHIETYLSMLKEVSTKFDLKFEQLLDCETVVKQLLCLSEMPKDVRKHIAKVPRNWGMQLNDHAAKQPPAKKQKAGPPTTPKPKPKAKSTQKKIQTKISPR